MPLAQRALNFAGREERKGAFPWVFSTPRRGTTNPIDVQRTIDSDPTSSLIHRQVTPTNTLGSWRQTDINTARSHAAQNGAHPTGVVPPA